MHRTHIHLVRSQPKKQFPRNRIRTVNRIQQRWLGIERQIAADSKRRLFSVPNIARAAERVSSDAKLRMIVNNSKTDAVSRAEELILVRQFKARVQVVPVQKLQCGFCHISIQVKNFAVVTLVVSSPNQTRGPVATLELPVVTDRRGRATDVTGFECFRILQKTMTNLHGPVAVWRKPKPHRTRVPRMCFEVVTVLIRLTTVKKRAFKLEPAILDSSRNHSETDVRRVLQVMRQRRRRVLRSRSAVHECVWSKCRFSRITSVNKPARTFANRNRISRTQLHEQIVWMLSIDQGLAFVRLTSLE